MLLVLDVNKLCRNVTVPAVWDSDDMYKYASYCLCSKDYRTWVLENISNNEIPLLLSAYDTIMEMNKASTLSQKNVDFIQTLENRYQEHIQSLSMSEQANILSSRKKPFAYETYEFIKTMIDGIHSLDDVKRIVHYCAIRYERINQTLKNLLEKKCLACLTVDECFDLIRDPEVSLDSKNLFFELNQILKNMNKKGFSVLDVIDLDLKHSLSIFRFIDTVSLENAIKIMKGKAIYPQQDIIHLDSMKLLKSKKFQRSDDNISSWINYKNPLIFYQEQAKKHGFLEEFYHFLLMEGDAKFEKGRYHWDHSVSQLRSKLVNFVKENPETVKSWHPNIEAVLEKKAFDKSIPISGRLCSVLNEYIKSTEPDAEVFVKLLGIKTKNAYINYWVEKYNDPSKFMNIEEINIHL